MDRVSCLELIITAKEMEQCFREDNPPKLLGIEISPNEELYVEKKLRHSYIRF